MSDCQRCEKKDSMDQGQHEAEIHRVSFQLNKNGTPEVKTRKYNSILMHDTSGDDKQSYHQEKPDMPRVHNPVKNHHQSYKPNEDDDDSDHDDEKKPILNEAV